MIENRKKFKIENIFFKVIFILYFSFLVWLLLNPGEDINGLDPLFFLLRYKDKVAHLLSFSLLFLTFSFAFQKVNISYTINWILIFGILIEFIQDIMPYGRTADIRDIYFDALGIFLGVIIYLIYKKIKNLKINRLNKTTK